MGIRLGRAARRPLPALAVLLVTFPLADVLAQPAPQFHQVQGDAARILFGQVTGDWVWEPAPVPAAPGDVVAPEVLQQIIPGMPPDATRAGYQGHVIVEATITVTGQISEPRIVRTPAADVFDTAALEAVRQWRFRPATREGVPVAVTGIFTFRFAVTYGTGRTVGGVSRSDIDGIREVAVRMGTANLVPPRKLTHVLPEYTAAAKEAGIQGDVYIEAVVTAEGTIVEPRLVRGLADDELNSRALAAIAEWTFEPGRKDDQPVDVLALFTVTFRTR